MSSHTSENEPGNSSEKRDRAHSLEPGDSEANGDNDHSSVNSSSKKTMHDCEEETNTPTNDETDDVENRPKKENEISTETSKDTSSKSVNEEVVDHSKKVIEESASEQTLEEPTENEITTTTTVKQTTKKRSAADDVDGDSSLNTQDSDGERDSQEIPRKRATRQKSQEHNAEKETAKPQDSAANAAGFSQKFANATGDSEDWSEFEEKQPESKDTEKTKKEETPKYTFGATSGFGTKGWNSSSKLGFPTKSTPSVFAPGRLPDSSSNESSSVIKTSFGCFTKDSTSPFVLAASAPTENSNNPESAEGIKEKDDDETDDSNSCDDNNRGLPGASLSTFGKTGGLKATVAKEVKVITGEEDENTIYHTKAKLLVLDNETKNWKERGSGTLRINVSKAEDTDSMRSARLLMRVDSVYRVILNMKITSIKKVFIMQEKFVRFSGVEVSFKNDEPITKFVHYAVRTGSAAVAKDLYNHIISLTPKDDNA